MATLRDQIDTALQSTTFDPDFARLVRNQLSLRGQGMNTIIDDTALTDAEKLDHLSQLATTASPATEFPGGVWGAIALGAVIGIIAHEILR